MPGLVNIVTSPDIQWKYSKIPGGYLKPQVVTNPMFGMFLLHDYTYGKV